MFRYEVREPLENVVLESFNADSDRDAIARASREFLWDTHALTLRNVDASCVVAII